MLVMHWREKADIFCGFTLLPSDHYIKMLNKKHISMSPQVITKSMIRDKSRACYGAHNLLGNLNM